MQQVLLQQKIAPKNLKNLKSKLDKLDIDNFY